MKLDLDKAWTSGMRFTRKNAGLLVAIAGLLFFLPAAIFGVTIAPPEQAEGATFDEAMAVAVAYWQEHWWVFLISAVLSTLGSLAIYRLAAARDEGTVNEALQAAFRGFLPMVAASLMVGLPLGLLVGVIAALGGVAVILVLLVVPLALWLAMRTILTGPVLMAEGDLNPLRALKRSFTITKGNSLRILFFLLLLIVASAILLAVIGAVFGLIATAVIGGDLSVQLTTIVSAALESTVTVVVIACIAMIYRQLSSAPTSAAGVPKSGD